MKTAAESLAWLDAHYQGVFDLLNDLVTPEAVFDVFSTLSDNYTPTLTAHRVQGPAIERLVAQGIGSASPVKVERNLRGSGVIGVTVGEAPPALWLSAHTDICSYLITSRGEDGRYVVTPFCSHGASPGSRTAVALGDPAGEGPLERLVEGVMVTHEDGSITFECGRTDLPPWTRVVHHLPARWDRETGQIFGFFDNQGGSTAILMAARVLSHLKANVFIALCDEEEGPVATGSLSFARASRRLLARTPPEQLPNLVVVTDGHSQEAYVKAGQPARFGHGALFSGMGNGARGSVTPPHYLPFLRALSTGLAGRGIDFVEDLSYVGRSDDISYIHATQNVLRFGFAGIYAHFDKTPYANIDDMVNLVKVFVVFSLIAQDPEWQAAYL